MFGYYADLDQVLEDHNTDPTDTVESSTETPDDIDLI